MPSSLFNPYIPNVYGVKYNKSQLTRYFTEHPTATYNDAKLWINIGIYEYINGLREQIKLDWTDKTLQQNCKQIRRDIRNGNMNVIGYKLERNNISTVVENISFYLKGYSFMDNVKILDTLSQHQCIDNNVDDCKLNWGQCVLGKVAQKRVLFTFDLNEQYRKSQIQKECIIGSMCYFDESDFLLTRTLINKVTSIKKDRLIKIQRNRLIIHDVGRCMMINMMRINIDHLIDIHRESRILYIITCRSFTTFKSNN